MKLRIAVGVLVLAFGALIGFVMSGAGASSGSIGAGTSLPPVTNITTTPQTIRIPPVLPTTTTTTTPKAPRLPAQITKIVQHVTPTT